MFSQFSGSFIVYMALYWCLFKVLFTEENVEIWPQNLNRGRTTVVLLTRTRTTFSSALARFFALARQTCASFIGWSGMHNCWITMRSSMTPL